MFKAIYLIDSETGLSFLSKKYSRINYREDLIAGYLKAMETFLQATFDDNQQAGQVKAIVFENLRISYNQIGRLLVVGIADGDETDAGDRAFLDEISHEFYAQFQQQIEGFRGDISRFKSFSSRLHGYRPRLRMKRSGINHPATKDGPGGNFPRPGHPEAYFPGSDPTDFLG